MVLEHLGSMSLDNDPEVTEAGPDDLSGVWDLVSEAYGVGPTLAWVAIPEDVFETPGESVWLLPLDGVGRRRCHGDH